MRASTWKPSGARETESPWLIHTLSVFGRVARSLPLFWMDRGVRPYSRCPVLATDPPRAWAMTWKP